MVLDFWGSFGVVFGIRFIVVKGSVFLVFRLKLFVSKLFGV